MTFRRNYPLNRENKRKKYEKGYYKTHPCGDSFTCKVCGRLVVAPRLKVERNIKRIIREGQAE